MAENYLKTALERLHQVDKLPQYSSYLKDEWISTKEDIWSAVQDEATWNTLKLPARLKLELRKVVQEEQDNASFTTPIRGNKGNMVSSSPSLQEELKQMINSDNKKTENERGNPPHTGRQDEKKSTNTKHRYQLNLEDVDLLPTGHETISTATSSARGRKEAFVAEEKVNPPAKSQDKTLKEVDYTNNYDQLRQSKTTDSESKQSFPVEQEDFVPEEERASYDDQQYTNNTNDPNDEWQLYYSDEYQCYYYYNNITGESQWATQEEYTDYDYQAAEGEEGEGEGDAYNNYNYDYDYNYNDGYDYTTEQGQPYEEQYDVSGNVEETTERDEQQLLFSPVRSSPNRRSSTRSLQSNNQDKRFSKPRQSLNKHSSLPDVKPTKNPLSSNDHKARPVSSPPQQQRFTRHSQPQDPLKVPSDDRQEDGRTVETMPTTASNRETKDLIRRYYLQSSDDDDDFRSKSNNHHVDNENDKKQKEKKKKEKSSDRKKELQRYESLEGDYKGIASGERSFSGSDSLSSASSLDSKHSEYYIITESKGVASNDDENEDTLKVEKYKLPKSSGHGTRQAPFRPNSDKDLFIDGIDYNNLDENNYYYQASAPLPTINNHYNFSPSPRAATKTQQYMNPPPSTTYMKNGSLEIKTSNLSSPVTPITTPALTSEMYQRQHQHHQNYQSSSLDEKITPATSPDPDYLPTNSTGRKTINNMRPGTTTTASYATPQAIPVVTNVSNSPPVIGSPVPLNPSDMDNSAYLAMALGTPLRDSMSSLRSSNQGVRGTPRQPSQPPPPTVSSSDRFPVKQKAQPGGPPPASSTGSSSILTDLTSAIKKKKKKFSLNIFGHHKKHHNNHYSSPQQPPFTTAYYTDNNNNSSSNNNHNHNNHNGNEATLQEEIKRFENVRVLKDLGYAEKTAIFALEVTNDDLNEAIIMLTEAMGDAPLPYGDSGDGMEEMHKNLKKKTGKGVASSSSTVDYLNDIDRTRYYNQKGGNHRKIDSSELEDSFYTLEDNSARDKVQDNGSNGNNGHNNNYSHGVDHNNNNRRNLRK